MQIDVLSQNTLKLTLSRLDMFDMDIKYESLSGKNPDTKRLLSHVLRTVKLDKSAGVDFSGERLFVEAFPRPDGGCMLYISCLLEERERERLHSFAPEKKTVRLNAKPVPRKSETLLCRFDSVIELDGACKALAWQGRLSLHSSLYYGKDEGEYRLVLHGDDKKLISSVVSEYGELLTSDEISFTCEHYKLIADGNAVEKMSSVL
jgi:negative regulator of genetic competence, sporulation and motility